jgi:hypothetical protein
MSFKKIGKNYFRLEQTREDLRFKETEKKELEDGRQLERPRRLLRQGLINLS